MKTRQILKVNVLGVYKEHTYVQHPFLEIKGNNDDIVDIIDDIHDTLRFHKDFPSIYMNHYVLKLNNGMYLGVNDLKVSLGFMIGELPDSQYFELEKPIKLRLYNKIQ